MPNLAADHEELLTASLHGVAEDRWRAVCSGVMVICGLALIGMAFAPWVDLRFILHQFGAPLYARSFVWSGTRLGEGQVCIAGGATLMLVAGAGWARPQVAGLGVLPAVASAVAVGVAIRSAPAAGITAWPWATLAVALVAGTTAGSAWPGPVRRRIPLGATAFAVIAAAFFVGHLFHHAMAAGPAPIVN